MLVEGRSRSGGSSRSGKSRTSSGSGRRFFSWGRNRHSSHRCLEDNNNNNDSNNDSDYEVSSRCNDESSSWVWIFVNVLFIAGVMLLIAFCKWRQNKEQHQQAQSEESYMNMYARPLVNDNEVLPSQQHVQLTPRTTTTSKAEGAAVPATSRIPSTDSSGVYRNALVKDYVKTTTVSSNFQDTTSNNRTDLNGDRSTTLGVSTPEPDESSEVTNDSFRRQLVSDYDEARRGTPVVQGVHV